jgi:FXSXX-COOH protein
MREDAGDLGGGPIDLSGVPLRDLFDLSGSALDRALARLLDRTGPDQEAAGFQSRV